MSAYQTVRERLRKQPKIWLITGVAGFIGSNLLETLLQLDQSVVGLDNRSTGSLANLKAVRRCVTARQWKRFSFKKGDIRQLAVCEEACRGIDYVLHQAALGSVPLSIRDPLRTHSTNVTGFLNMLLAGRKTKIKRFVYASSCAVYGDNPDLPKREGRLGACLSPYAVRKRVNELYADVLARAYAFESIGLRYFNVFGPRQDPAGAYAAVIPKWIASMMQGETIHIHGDGKSSRDFCYVANVVQANLLAATAEHSSTGNEVYNIAAGRRTTLNSLFELLRERLLLFHPRLKECTPVYGPFREGDVRHSEGDISKASRHLGYEPT